jgi:hypothetical protein
MGDWRADLRNAFYARVEARRQWDRVREAYTYTMPGSKAADAELAAGADAVDESWRVWEAEYARLVGVAGERAVQAELVRLNAELKGTKR